jgi:hypothetical protein
MKFVDPPKESFFTARFGSEGPRPERRRGPTPELDLVELLRLLRQGGSHKAASQQKKA